MYTVLVKLHGETIDSRNFKFGTWAEIGFWLDNYGYNNDHYKVVIYFNEAGHTTP